MRYAADMPELREDLSARAMHRVGDRRPARDLLGGMNARGADIADALRAHLAGLGDDQAGGGALGVIGGGQRVRDIAFDRAAARHRRHHQAVAQREIAQTEGRMQRRRLLIGLMGGKGGLQGGRLMGAHGLLLSETVVVRRGEKAGGLAPPLVVLTGNTT